MIKLSDYVIGFLVQQGITDIFMVSGGGIIHLVDSLGRNKSINYFCNYNEQATTYAAEGYARAKNGISAALVTTGPGSTNSISGVASAFMDSVPMLVISGQIKRELIADYRKLRQIGEQEVNIVDIVKPITKYAVTIIDPKLIRRELEQAVYKATSGRPGPAWVNIPLDVQSSFIDQNELVAFSPPAAAEPQLSSQAVEALSLLKAARRPILLCGYGIRLAKAEYLLEQLLKEINIPVVLSFNGMDLIAESHPLLIGKPGIIGQRRANFALQNSDCLLAIGSRLNIKVVGYNYRAFAPRAKKIIVDIDAAELEKLTVSADLAIKADAGDFLKELLSQIKQTGINIDQTWLRICQDWKQRYPSIISEFFQDKKYVNTYVFYDKLSDIASPADIVISGNGMAAVCLYQAFKVKDKQRVFTNNGYGAMGWGLPASIGACIAGGGKRVICVTGDGSLQMNIQELELIKHHRLPIKLFILNNSGYSSIRLTQDTFFNSHYVGSGPASGVSNPDFKKLAQSYGLAYEKISTNRQTESKINKVLSTDRAVVCEVNISAAQGLNPKLASYQREDGAFQSPPLEDMFPFLPREELKKNMSISKE